MTIAIASVLLTIGFRLWTARYVVQIPGSVLYDYQSDIQEAVAAFVGICLATLIYFLVTGRRFVAATVIAFILMSATAITAVLFGAAEEKLGLETLMGLIALPLLAAVATKAANIASKKERDTGVYKKFKESFEAALDVKNFAELLLWTIAWTAGGFGVFFLSKAIAMW